MLTYIHAYDDFDNDDDKILQRLHGCGRGGGEICHTHRLSEQGNPIVVGWGISQGSSIVVSWGTANFKYIAVVLIFFN